MNEKLRLRPWSAALLGAAILILVPALAAAQTPEYNAELQLLDPGQPVESEHDCNDPDNPVGNCGFEDQAPTLPPITDWNVADASAPFLPVQTVPAGTSAGFDFFVTAPTEGVTSLFVGFDAGGGPDTIEVSQDVTIAAGSGAALEFDYRGAWDMTFGATLDRTFEVQVQPAGGGAPMQTDLLLTAQAGETVTDTGPLSATVDLSSFNGQDVRIALVCDIPEVFTGPGQIEIDNVLITVDASVPTVTIPTQSAAGLAALIALLAAASIFFIRRRSRSSSG